MAKDYIIGILLCGVLITNGVAHPYNSQQRGLESNQEFHADIEAFLQQTVKQSESVGVALALIYGGEIQFFLYGKESINESAHVSEKTVFEIGSITKVFTTFALIDLVIQGKINLDDSVESYLPNLKLPEFKGKKITLRHLATHHSGLPRLPDNFHPQNLANPYQDYTVENLYEFLNHYTLLRAPGDAFEYSNLGMGLLGHILCLSTHKNYEQLIADSVTKQLNMQNTRTELTPEMKQSFAKGHHLGQSVEHWDFPHAVAGAGALRSNIKDMTHFLAANMNLINSPVVDLLRECHKPQISAGANMDIGLGWLISHSSTADVIWHNGGTGGFRTFLGFNPKTQKGVVILSNTTEGWPDLLAFSLLDPESYKHLSVTPTQ